MEHPERPGEAFLGISIISPMFLNRITSIDPNVLYEVKDSYSGYQKSIINWIDGLVSWVSFISVSVAIANLLPFLPFDGGVMWQALFEKITKNEKLAKKMILVLTVITYSLLILNLIGIQKILGLIN
jgi:membrane-associated protease RseP (regulator of RpoE activity)